MKERSLQEIADEMGVSGRFLGSVDHFCIDSREVKTGSLFFALKGERVDGHDYLEGVAKRRGAVAVVSKSYQGDDFGLIIFRVDDVVLFLQQLAQRELAKWDGRIIGITGSVGKTTTKEFLATILEKKFRLFKSPLSYNSKVTLPLNILNARGDEELFVLEMAMSEKGEIRRLVEIAPIHFAIITKIGRTHTEFFPDGIEGVAEAKGEILESPNLQLAVIPNEALGYSGISSRGSCKKISFGSGGADYEIKREGETFRIIESGEPGLPFTLPFTAEHLCSNFLAAVAMSRALGLEWEEIFSVAEELKPASKRFETVVKEGVTFINDSYNASAESTVAALKNLPAPEENGKTVFVFGEMRELGKFSEQSHHEVGEVAAERVDHLLCLGEACAPTMKALREKGKQVDLFNDFESLKKRLFCMTSKGDVVLIKGANSHQLWRILE